jgi:hypothetical protein
MASFSDRLASILLYNFEDARDPGFGVIAAMAVSHRQQPYVRILDRFLAVQEAHPCVWFYEGCVALQF